MWLGYSMNNFEAYKFSVKPHFDPYESTTTQGSFYIIYGTGETEHVKNPPKFLKPGELWRQDRKVTEDFIPDGYYKNQYKFDGYWWVQENEFDILED